MDQRKFGKELTNLPQTQLPRSKRGSSSARPDRLREQSVAVKQTAAIPSKPALSQNRTLPLPKLPQPKVELSDPQMVPDYFFQSMQFMKEQERANYKLDNYISTHKTVSEHSRAKLIDWLSDLHQKYKMFPQTIFTVVCYIDRYLAAKEVPLEELQLVGVAGLFLAAKFEETYQVPQLRQLASCCAGQYSPAQILEKEADIIKHLEFSLIVTSAYKFFKPLCRLIGLQSKNQHLAQYVLELALLQPTFLEYPPSLMASAAIYLIKKIRRSESPWNDVMTSIVGYRESELKNCAKDLCNLLENAGEIENCKSIKKKFALPAFHEVTRIKSQRKQRK